MLCTNHKKDSTLWLITIRGINAQNDKKLGSFLYLKDLSYFLKRNDDSKCWELCNTSLKLNSCPKSLLRLFPRICSVIGIENQLGYVLHYISHHFRSFSNRQYLPAINVYGDEGVGKTHFALTLTVAARIIFGYATIFMDCKKIQATKTSMNEILKELTKIVAQAYKQSPSIIVLDNLDFLAPDVSEEEMNSNTSHLRDQAKIIIDHLLSLLRETYMIGSKGCSTSKIVILSTSNSNLSIHKSLRLPDRIDNSSELNFPVAEIRKQMFIRQAQQFLSHPNDWVDILEELSFSQKTDVRYMHDYIMT